MTSHAASFCVVRGSLVTGHASLSEVQRYTKAADRKRMAREAMAKLVEGGW
jgi:hypothetical protein